jgi:2'-phosphotransferase
MAKDRVRLSKALSWLLRHNAEKEGFVFLEGGFLPVLEVLKHKRFGLFTLSLTQKV